MEEMAMEEVAMVVVVATGMAMVVVAATGMAMVVVVVVDTVMAMVGMGIVVVVVATGMATVEVTAMVAAVGATEMAMDLLLPMLNRVGKVAVLVAKVHEPHPPERQIHPRALQKTPKPVDPEEVTLDAPMMDPLAAARARGEDQSVRITRIASNNDTVRIASNNDTV